MGQKDYEECQDQNNPDWREVHRYNKALDDVSEFKKFHQDNPQVYRLFKKFTYTAIGKGHNRLSSEMIINRIRWETEVETSDPCYKINNDYKPFYARMFMAENPQYQNFFNVRGSHADEIDWKEYVVQANNTGA